MKTSINWVGPDPDALLREHLPLVKRIATQIRGRYGNLLEMDELIQAGLLGLHQAIQRYTPGAAVFTSFATSRIRGAMLDQIREADPLSRGDRQRLREIEAAVERLANELGRPASEGEIAEALGMTLQDYQDNLLALAGAQAPVNVDDFAALLPDTADDPEASLCRQQCRQQLAQWISELPDREQLVLQLYFGEDLTLREVGAVLDLSEARASQILNQAIIRLRANRLKTENMDC